MTADLTQEQPGITWTLLLVRFAILFLLLAVVLFATTGRLDWWMGWAYLLTFLVLTFGGRALMMIRSPEMLAERATATNRDDVKSWDKILMPLMAILLPFGMVIVAGLDVRFGWSPALPVWMAVSAWGLIVIGILFSNWAMLANRFFSGVVRIQSDRDHTVVTDGPYSLVRHPGYSGGIVANLVTPIMLGSLWALIPAVVLCALTILRTALEDRTLQEELPGYREYTQETRHRLFPGIW